MLPRTLPTLRALARRRGSHLLTLEVNHGARLIALVARCAALGLSDGVDAKRAARLWRAGRRIG